jgi:hypothetical protein
LELAFVTFDDAGIAKLRLADGAPELALGTTLSQQIPALIKLFGYVPEPSCVSFRGARPGAQSMLFGDQRCDVFKNGLVAHAALPLVDWLDGAEPARTESVQSGRTKWQV